MSDFSDFDEFLRFHEYAKRQSQNAFTQQIIQNRKDKDPLIKNVFTLFKEYHQTIVSPRTHSFLVFKKHEEISLSVYFLYRIQVIPTDFLPLAFDLRYTHLPYLQSGKITSDDWYPNVAMQFDLKLQDVTLTPSIDIKVWGRLEEDAQKPLSANIKLLYAKDWSFPYTRLTIQSKTEPLKQTKEALMLITSQLLKHREVVWKKKF